MDLKKASNFTAKTGKLKQQSLTPALNVAIIPALFNAEAKEWRVIRKIMGAQLLVVLIVSLAFGWGSLPQYATAIIAGGGVSILNTALIAWRMSRAKLHSSKVASQQLRYLYFYAAERFLAVVVSLGVCLVVLRLVPLAVLSGFVLGQAALITSRLLFKD